MKEADAAGGAQDARRGAGAPEAPSDAGDTLPAPEYEVLAMRAAESDSKLGAMSSELVLMKACFDTDRVDSVVNLEAEEFYGVSMADSETQCDRVVSLHHQTQHVYLLQSGLGRTAEAEMLSQLGTGAEASLTTSADRAAGPTRSGKYQKAEPGQTKAGDSDEDEQLAQAGSDEIVKGEFMSSERCEAVLALRAEQLRVYGVSVIDREGSVVRVLAS